MDLFSVRAQFRNGVVAEFSFRDVGRAQSCYKVLGEAKDLGHKVPPQPCECEIRDDAGHEALIHGGALEAVQFSDIEAEIIGRYRVMMFAQEIETKIREKLGLPSIGQNDAQPAPRAAAPVYPDTPSPPPNGAIAGHFAS